MADIKLTDIFGGVGGMSDQVVINKNDIAKLNTDLGTKVSKSGDTINGKVRINRTGSNIWPNDTVNNSNNFINRAIGTFAALNSAIHIFGDEKENARRMGIQSAHADPAYTTSYGVLDLNPFGGLVRANGHAVYHAGAMQQTIPALDIRSEDRKPAYFTGKSFTTWFNNTGMPTANTWYSGITMKGWEDTYATWQLFSFSSTGTSDNKLYFRTGKETTWNPSYEVYHSGRKPHPSELGVYSKTETDNLFTKKAGDSYTGMLRFSSAPLQTSNQAHIFHDGGTAANTPINIRSMREHGSATWVWEKICNGELRYTTGVTAAGTDRIKLNVSAGNISLTGEYNTVKPDNFRIVYGGYGVFWRNDGINHYLMATAKDDAYGPYNGLRPLSFALTTGRVTMGNGVDSHTFNATDGGSGQGFTFNGKTVAGGTNDSWLRLNPAGQFVDGIYCGSTGTLRHDGTIQRGGWGSNAAANIRPATDGGWSVNGNAAFSYTQVNTNSAHWILASYKDSATIRSGIQVLSNDGGNLRFYTNGRANFAEIADGNFLAQNNVTAYSDIRVKKNIVRIENALDKTLKLNGVTYDRTDQDNVRQVGLIAQEVEQVLPEAVITSVNGDITDFKSVAYGNLVGLLVESIRELNNKIERLEALVKE